MKTCTLFAGYTASLSRNLASADPSLTSSSKSSKGDGNGNGNTDYDPEKLDQLFSILGKYEEHFNAHLKILLDALNYLAATETVVFLGLCARLGMVGE